ncbi:MAG: hypothetical protein IPK76_15710 [Lewinellaceae bacterium]|jgi:hypothetical protein|nr:hypothetical protein [Lewinellaceae bacterium]
MNKHPFIHVLFGAALLCQIVETSGQTPWNQVNLSSSQSKIMTSRAPKTSVRFSAGLPVGNTPDAGTNMEALQQAAFAPDIYEQLFEKLGGEFIIGNLSGQQNPPAQQPAKLDIMPGLQVGLRIGRRLDIQANAQYYKATWSGAFPVTVFPQDQPVPKSLNGTIHTSASCLILELGTSLFITRGAVQPYAKAGIRGLFPLDQDARAAIGGVVFSPITAQMKQSFSPFGGAGLQVRLGKRVFADMEGMYGKLPGGGVAATLSAGVGYRF